MSREKWRAVRDLVHELAAGDRQVEFYQLVRLIERSRCVPALLPPGAAARRPPGTTPRLVDEAIRFRAAIAAHFQAASVLHADLAPPESQSPVTLDTTFLAAAGAQGVLPAHYTTLILQRLKDGDTALKDFLDLFHHRLVTALVRAWERHSPVAVLRGNADAPPGAAPAEAQIDLFTRCIQALTNHKRYATATDYDRNVLLYYSGVFQDRRRPSGSLAAVLEDYFGVKARIDEFHPVLTRLRLEHRWRLPGSLSSGHAGAKLGQGILLGEAVQVVQTSFLVRIGPLRRDQFGAYLPEGVHFPPLNQLIRHFVGFEFVFAIQLLLRAEEAPEFRLGGTGPGARLGWETWLLSAPSQRDVLDDVRFVVTT